MRYRVTVRGRLGHRVRTLLEDLELEQEDGQESCYVVELSDQADLYGLLSLLQAVGVQLVSIVEVRAGE